MVPLKARPAALQARAGFLENRGRGGDNYDLQWIYR